MSLLTQGTVISRLRLRGAPADSLAMRQRLGSMLSAADLEPAGLPVTAIVVIRSLRDPQPGRLRLMQAGQPLPLAWQQAVGQSINALARHAARPARGFVADSADAVVFMDRSELLACLARDWCSNAIATRWWWRSLVRDPDIARAVATEWLQGPEYVPAALQQLATTRQAAAFVQRLDEDVVQQLLEWVVERFDLTSLRQIFRNRTATFANFSVGSQLPADTSPWLPWVPEAVHAGLSRQQANLLGITLLLQRAPSVARSARLADVILQYSVDRERPGVRPVKADPASAIDRGNDDPDGAVIDDRNSSSPVAVLAESAPRDQHLGSVADGEPERANGSSAEARPEPSVGDSVLPTLPPHSLPATEVDQELVVNRQKANMASPEFAATPEQLEARWVDSEYGGVLFLINLGQFLDLYGDFSQPAEPGIELPIWDFVALLGEEFVGGELRRDPLWPLLAELAGRQPGEEPGLHYQPPADWRMPLSWLKPFAAGNHWEWSGRQSRLQIRHPAGFVVVDVAIPERNPTYRLDAELAPYRAAGLCTSAARRAPLARAGMWNNSLSLRERVGVRDIARTCAYPEVSPHPDLLPEGEGTGPFQHSVTRPTIRRPALRRWCGWLLPYVQSRLAAALGVNTGEVGKLLCACPARLRVTATHLDAHFALANLPINVRLAGLDRDPGWLPAAGRYIKFHFD